MRIPATLLCILTIAGCAGVLPDPGVAPDTPRTNLQPCTKWPNCVSSDATDPMHAVAPLRLAVPPEQAWPAIRAAIEALPQTRIVVDSGSYLRAESRNGGLGFTDDLELLLRPGSEIVAVRSASRVGLNDLGVNRRRVDALRTALLRQGVIR